MAAFVEGFRAAGETAAAGVTQSATGAAAAAGAAHWVPSSTVLSYLDPEQAARLQELGQGGGMEPVVQKIMGQCMRRNPCPCLVRKASGWGVYGVPEMRLCCSEHNHGAQRPSRNPSG